MSRLPPHPVISVIVPCRNARPYIDAAIRSVRAQAYEPLEILVIDDGSTDGSGDAVKSLTHNITYHRQDRRGLAAARNTGVLLSQGALLAFLDAEDLWTEGSLRARLDLLSRHRDYDAALGAVTQLGRDRARSGRHVGAMLIKKCAFLRVGPFEETVKCGETRDWFTRAVAAGVRMVATPDVVLRRRDRTPAMSDEGVHALQDGLRRAVGPAIR